MLKINKVNEHLTFYIFSTLRNFFLRSPLSYAKPKMDVRELLDQNGFFFSKMSSLLIKIILKRRKYNIQFWPNAERP